MCMFVESYPKYHINIESNKILQPIERDEDTVYRENSVA